MRSGGPIKRQPFRPKHSAAQRAAQRQRKASKALMWLRCASRCEMCGTPVLVNATEYAHRAQTGMGGRGDNSVINGLVSCPGPAGCNQRCSSDADFAVTARSKGWIIPRYSDPGSEPVWLFAHGWCLLLPTGDVHTLDVEPSTA